MRKFLLILVVLGLAGTLAWLAWLRSGPPTTLEGLFDAYAARGVQMDIQAPFNGVVLVASGDEVVFERAYGFADPERRRELTVDSRFLIGAGAKPVTAALVLQQVDAGVLALDGRVSAYLPDFPADPGRRITLHHLLSHTAGLPREAVDPESLTLDVPPGARYAFSNYGYDLLVSVLETATGRGYGELLREGIVEPLGLADTGYAQGEAMAAEVAPAMDFDEIPMPIALFTTTVGNFDEARPPSGAVVYTSARDLHRIARALRDGELLSAELTEEMFTPVLAGYAYGWARNREWAITKNPEAPLYTHVGRLASYNALVALYDEGLTVIVLSNVDPLDVATILHDSWLAAHGRTEIESTIGHPSLANPREFREQGGIEAFEHYYAELSERAGHPIEPDSGLSEQVVRLTARDQRFDEAIAFARSAVERGWIGASPRTLNGLGYEFLGDERFDEARALFQLNLELHPEYANGYDSLGDCLERSGDLRAARASYARALELAREQGDSNAGFYERRVAGVDEALADEGAP